MPKDVLLLLLLIVLNGIFAMSEIAVVSARRARLIQLAEDGSKGARHALTLASEPTRFLSSVQVGITSIGILNGAIGEGVIAARLRPALEQVPLLAPYADTLSLAIMVAVLTYVSLIIGELVPKRIALIHPETIASVIARPMEVVAGVTRPIVFLLSVSTDSILRLFRVRQAKQPGVTADEIRVMLEQGAEEGVFEPTEHELVTNVLNLDERHVGAVLTPRSNIVYVDIRDSVDTLREKLREQPHSVLPLCDGSLDKVLGFVRSTKVLERFLERGQPDLPSLAEPPLFVPETMTLMKLLEQFKRTHLPIALGGRRIRRRRRSGQLHRRDLVDRRRSSDGAGGRTRDRSARGRQLAVGRRRRSRHRIANARSGSDGQRRGPATLPHIGRTGDGCAWARAADRGCVRARRLSIRGCRHGWKPRRPHIGQPQTTALR
jgi:putative hemolysin